MNGETAWILISDAQTRMLHGDTCLSKPSPVKYLESFLQQYSPECKNKWVVLDQGGELYKKSEVSSRGTVIQSILLVPILHHKMALSNAPIVQSLTVSKVV